MRNTADEHKYTVPHDSSGVILNFYYPAGSEGSGAALSEPAARLAGVSPPDWGRVWQPGQSYPAATSRADRVAKALRSRLMPGEGQVEFGLTY